MGIGPRKGVLLGANLGRAIVTSGDTAYVCDSASTVGAAVWGGACGGLRHCCITWGPRRAKGREVLGFVLHFHNGKCHWVADGEFFKSKRHYNWPMLTISSFIFPVSAIFPLPV